MGQVKALASSSYLMRRILPFKLFREKGMKSHDTSFRQLACSPLLKLQATEPAQDAAPAEALGAGVVGKNGKKTMRRLRAVCTPLPDCCTLTSLNNTPCLECGVEAPHRQCALPHTNPSRARKKKENKKKGKRKKKIPSNKANMKELRVSSNRLALLEGGSPLRDYHLCGTTTSAS